jgi:hypothetical protein
MKNKNFLTGLVLLTVAALGFFSGLKYQQTKTPATFGNRAQFAPNGSRAGSGGALGNRAGGQMIGEVISHDDHSLTVKLQDGSSKIVLLGTNTSIIKPSQASVTDLLVGTRVAVFGQTNSDGSVTAQNIQLNPQERVATPSSSPRNK